MRITNHQPQSRRTNTFLHGNYFQCATQKLKACGYLIAQLGDFKDVALEHKVCHELFYLMGYIVEGLSVYTIYELVEWDKHQGNRIKNR